MNICEWTHVTLEGTKDARRQVLALIKDSLGNELKVGTYNLADDEGWNYVLCLRDAVKRMDKLISELEGETKDGKE